MQTYLMIGQIVKPQGVRGEVKVIPYTDDSTRFSFLETVYLDAEGKKSLKVCTARYGQDCVFLLFEGINTRNAAEGLRNLYLYVDRENAVPLTQDRYYIADLIGMTVLDAQGKMLGKLKDVFSAGGSDVYSVQGEERNFLFPALKRVLLEVNVKENRMVLDAQALSEVAVFED